MPEHVLRSTLNDQKSPPGAFGKHRYAPTLEIERHLVDLAPV